MEGVAIVHFMLGIMQYCKQSNMFIRIKSKGKCGRCCYCSFYARNYAVL